MVENSCIVFLHEHPELLNACSEFINREWKRSTSAREQSLEKSYKDLPDSLILVSKYNTEEVIIGHSRLTRVLEDTNGCWIGTVLISEEKRGQGFGKYLMKRTEEHAKMLGFNVAFLNTKDQEGFYEHIGYTYCDPVSSISFKWTGQKMTSSFNLLKKHTVIEDCRTNNRKEQNLPLNNGLSNIPPPPPPPVIKNVQQSFINTNLGCFWMKKHLL